MDRSCNEIKMSTSLPQINLEADETTKQTPKAPEVEVTGPYEGGSRQIALFVERHFDDEGS